MLSLFLNNFGIKPVVFNFWNLFFQTKVSAATGTFAQFSPANAIKQAVYSTLRHAFTERGRCHLGKQSFV